MRRLIFPIAAIVLVTMAWPVAAKTLRRPDAGPTQSTKTLKSGAVRKTGSQPQMSFNLQYLQLQDQMQNENRQYSAVSNIMKTKHDTAKNAIRNIR